MDLLDELCPSLGPNLEEIRQHIQLLPFLPIPRPDVEAGQTKLLLKRRGKGTDIGRSPGAGGLSSGPSVGISGPDGIVVRTRRKVIGLVRTRRSGCALAGLRRAGRRGTAIIFAMTLACVLAVAVPRSFVSVRSRTAPAIPAGEGALVVPVIAGPAFLPHFALARVSKLARVPLIAAVAVTVIIAVFFTAVPV